MSTVAAETTAPKAQAQRPGFVKATTLHDATPFVARRMRCPHSLGPLAERVSGWTFFVVIPTDSNWRRVGVCGAHPT